jgi:hypothetical protein
MFGSKISCIIMGGLGNQLFQVFTIMALSLKLKRSFIFPNKKLGGDKRQDVYWDTLFAELKKDTFDTPIHKLRLPMYKETTFHYNDEIHRHPLVTNPLNGVALFGYFQSYKYFEKETNQIIKYMKLQEKKQNMRKLLTRICGNKYTISLHFRLGDYKSLTHHYTPLGLDYYENSILNILNVLNTLGSQPISQDTISSDHNVLYFCEDNDLAEVEPNINQLRSRFPSIVFQRAPNNIEDWQSMLLMSCCDHNIIANSTFSWWSAYLNTNPNKIVCYPDNWFGPALPTHNTNDLCPPSWRKIKWTPPSQ